jgi:hypothetical protein
LLSSSRTFCKRPKANSCVLFTPFPSALHSPHARLRHEPLQPVAGAHAHTARHGPRGQRASSHGRFGIKTVDKNSGGKPRISGHRVSEQVFVLHCLWEWWYKTLRKYSACGGPLVCQLSGLKLFSTQSSAHLMGCERRHLRRGRGRTQPGGGDGRSQGGGGGVDPTHLRHRTAGEGGRRGGSGGGGKISGWTLRARWVTLRARWVTLRSRWVTLRARWVTLRARWVTRRARWVTLRARWVTRGARWVTLRARWVTR